LNAEHSHSRDTRPTFAASPRLTDTAPKPFMATTAEPRTAPLPIRPAGRPVGKPVGGGGTTKANDDLDAEIARIKAGLMGTPVKKEETAKPAYDRMASNSEIYYPPSSSVLPTAKGSGDVSPMSATELKQLCALVEDVCGIHIDASKQYLLETRLLKVLVENNCQSYTDFIRLVRGPKQDQLRPKLIDAITTKETLWFRDTHPFETLKSHVFKDVLARSNGQPVRVWSAACSTGQEAYSIAMSVHEFVKDNPNASSWLNGGFKILGTDIATSAVMLSKLGRYDMVAMGRGISEERKAKFFTAAGRAHTVNPELKRMCDFKIANLQHDLPKTLGTGYDMIFMRNVAIYFTKEFKQELYTKVAKMLKPGGCLIIGGTESMVGVNNPFHPESVGPSTVYRLK
jgi:chemotaxis protein methyltransferase CheR